MWRRVTLGLLGVGLGLFAAFVFGIGALETYSVLTAPPQPASGDGFVGDSFRPWWFPWSHLVVGGAGLFAASCLLRRAA